MKLVMDQTVGTSGSAQSACVRGEAMSSVCALIPSD